MFILCVGLVRLQDIQHRLQVFPLYQYVLAGLEERDQTVSQVGLCRFLRLPGGLLKLGGGHVAQLFVLFLGNGCACHPNSTELVGIKNDLDIACACGHLE